MGLKKLEWLSDFDGFTIGTLRRPDGDWESANEPLKYKRGEIIEVDEMGDNNFRDVARNVNFAAIAGQYRLL